ncbi:MAG TPA: acyl-CoA dehydrogenase family protein [Terriglobales bacterium]|nr:acyl-CoA dehydrogenase family protein [Terriglobales bacterium]
MRITDEHGRAVALSMRKDGAAGFTAPTRQYAFEIADQLVRAFAQTAVERDKKGGTAKTERDLLRASGLLNVTIPPELGGWGLDWPDTMKLVRIFARVDSSIAHLFGFQHLMLASVSLYGSRQQTEQLFSDTVRNKCFWGNALNPLDTRTRATPHAAVGFLINGRKSFCSGATDSDMLIVSAIHSGDQKFMVAAIPSDRPGIRIRDDWDSMGQRQTDSGTVEFNAVPVGCDEFLRTPGPLGSIRASLRSLIAQLILSNIFLGLAEGALDEARNYTLATTRPWANSTGIENASEDPYILANYGRFFVDLRAAQALTAIAGESLQRAWESGEAITESQRGKCAVDVAASKVVTTKTGLAITSQMFEVMGARAAAGPARLDRYWRNLRTHTLHDPVDYKTRELGDFALNHRLPKATFYS